MKEFMVKNCHKYGREYILSKDPSLVTLMDKPLDYVTSLYEMNPKVLDYLQVDEKAYMYLFADHPEVFARIEPKPDVGFCKGAIQVNPEVFKHMTDPTPELYQATIEELFKRPKPTHHRYFVGE